MILDILKKRWKLILLVAVVLVFLIPLLINVAFKSDWGIEWLYAEWDASAALGFYGSVTSAFLTICGVFFTIKYTLEISREEKRSSVLPYFSSSYLKTKSRRNLLLNGTDTDLTENTDEKESQEYYSEFELRDFCFIISNGLINVTSKLTSEQMDLIKNGGFKNESWAPGVIATVSVDMVNIPIKLTNVGNGASICTRLSLYKKDTPEKDRLYTVPIPIEQGGTIGVRIFSDDFAKESPSVGEYNLDICYSDILGNPYIQTNYLSFYYAEDNHHLFMKAETGIQLRVEVDESNS